MVWGKVYSVVAFGIYSAITYHGFKHQDTESLAIAAPIAMLWPVFTPVAAALAVDYYETTKTNDSKLD